MTMSPAVPDDYAVYRTRRPIVLTGRSDSALERVASCAMALLIARM